MSVLKKTCRKLVVTSVVAFSLGISSTAHSEDPLKEIFGVMTTSTGASAYESQKRNGVAFGTFSARFSMYQPKVVSFTPPSLSAGCGGIDFFGGSISLIKKEELVQMGRAIAAGAAVYAFNLAIESICPSCAEGMAWLQDKLEQFNELVSADCDDVVTALSENKVGQGFADSIKGVANVNGWQEKLGSFADVIPDTHGSWVDMLSDRSKTGDPKDVELDGMEGNWIWNALGEAKIDDWSFNPKWDKKLIQELLMSLTGTIILGQKDADDIEKKSIGATLQVKDLVYLEKGSKIKVLKCDNNEAKKDGRLPCTKLIGGEEGIEMEWEGLHHQVMRQLIGDPDVEGIAKKVTYKRTLTSTQKGLVETASVPLMNMLFMLGKDPAAQESVASLIASLISFQAVDELVDSLYQMLKRAELAEKGNLKTNAERIAFLKEQIKSLEGQRAELKKKHDAEVRQANNIYDTYLKLTNNVKNMGAPGI